jgi:preprotein translocase subunit YajC
MIDKLDVEGKVQLEDGSPAPDGEHELADGTKIVTEGGVIKEIKAAEEPAVEIEVEAGNKVEEKMAEVVAEFQSKIDSLATEKAALEAKLADIEKKQKEGFSAVLNLIEEVTKLPQADPTEQPQSFKFQSSKDVKFERLNKYRNAILNNKN